MSVRNAKKRFNVNFTVIFDSITFCVEKSNGPAFTSAIVYSRSYHKLLLGR